MERGHTFPVAVGSEARETDVESHQALTTCVRWFVFFFFFSRARETGRDGKTQLIGLCPFASFVRSLG